MSAVHWIRSRQEERELDYWLSIVAFERQDRSFLNRLYLLYLFIFFGAWIFAMLTFFASGGALILRLVGSVDPRQAALSLELLLLGAWSIYSLWRSCRRSPVVFSEADEVIICHTPVDRRLVTARWFFMPWFKSALFFWIIAIILGFSIAEISMPGVMGANRIPEYAVYGIRPWLAILPIQFGLFAFQWAVGIFRLQKGEEKRWLGWIVTPVAIVFFTLLFVLLLPASSMTYPSLRLTAATVTYPLQVGFSGQNLGLTLLAGAIFGLLMFVLMVWVSSTFSLSRAAQETREAEALKSAGRYGMSNYAEEIQTRRRLGVMRSPSRLHPLFGAGSLVWKGLLQARRTFRLTSLFPWFSIAALAFGISLLPDPGSLILVVAFWVIQVGQRSVARLRSDLSLWPLSRQLPISHKRFVLAELAPTFFLILAVSLAGFLIGSAVFAKPLGMASLIIPGLVASVAGISAYDVIQRSRSNLLLVGSVPSIGARGILLGLLIAVVILLVAFILPGIAGIALSVILGLSLAWFTFGLAARSYGDIRSS